MNPLSSAEFKVGALVVAVSLLIGGMSMRVSEGPGLFKGSKRYWFIVDNAGGLIPQSAVKMAGIKVGIIEKIELANGQARVTLLLEKPTPFSANGWVELRADGILGDKHVELFPGDSSEPPLPSNSRINIALNKGSLDSLINEVGNITTSIKSLAETLNKAASGEGDQSSTVGRILMNFEELSRNLADISGNNKEKIASIVSKIEVISSSIEELVSNEGPGGLNAAWSNMSSTLARMERSMKNIEDITNKVNDGEGTIGRLINDEDTVEKINVAVENVNEFLGGAKDMETSIDFHSEFLTGDSVTKSYLFVKIQPGLDRHYELGIVDDPLGVTKVTNTTTETTGGATVEEKETKNSQKIKFSALFAKNFYNFTVKGGLMENSGGVGIDYHLFNRRLRFSVEAFDMQDLYARAFLRYYFTRGIYLVGGGDDLFSNGENGFNSFIGGGIFITNDDLKFLASQVSF